MSKLLINAGDTHTEGFGPGLATPTLLVTMTLHLGGISFHVSDGVQRVAELCKTYTDRAQAIAFYRHVRDAAMQGKRIHQIVWELQALEEAQNAAEGRTPDQIADALTADIDAHHAGVVQRHNDTVTAVQEASGDGQGWYRARQAAGQPARIVHPTRTRVHCKPLTGVELDLIRHHVNGVVTTRPGQAWTVLRAIERRGYGTPTYRDGTRIIASIRLNARGLDAAVEQVGVAA